MIEQFTLEGFHWGSQIWGKTHRIRTITFFFKEKIKRILAITRRISHENPPYFACADFLIFPIDLKWSLALGSFKMKVNNDFQFVFTVFYVVGHTF